MNHDLEKLLAKSKGIKIRPQAKLPKDCWHVCLLQPMPNAINHEASCQACGVTVYYGDTHHHLKKICPPCALKLTQGRPIDALACEESLVKAIAHRHRN